jgi:hypothetical protein
MRTVVSLIALAASLAACSSPAESTSPSAPLEDTKARLAGLLDKVNADDCSAQGRDRGKCIVETKPVALGDVRIDDASPETVMLVDALPGLAIDTIRYQNRIAAYYRWTPAGTLDDSPFELEAPRTLRDILTSLQTSAFAPSERYSVLSEPLLQKYYFTFTNVTSPGTLSFNLLVEHLPKHALVLVNVPEPSGELASCKAFVSPDLRARMRVFYESAAEQLRGVMKKHNVHYVNFNGSLDLPSLKRSWLSSNCLTSPVSDDDLRAYIDAVSPLYESLFAMPGVVATQAASYDMLPAGDAPFDQASPKFYNRIRVGALVARDSGLDERGVGATPALLASLKPALGGADVYPNIGVLDRRGKDLAPMPMLMADGFGTSVSPALAGISTSSAAPLALARLVNLRESKHAGAPFDDALIATLRDELTPRACDAMPEQRCLAQDPLAHGQTEDLRLGYRPRVFTPAH